MWLGSFIRRTRRLSTHLVIQSRGKATVALEWTRGVLGRLGLTLNEKKTSIRHARQERFDYLGYTFGPHINPRGGGRYIGYSPSQKTVSRIKQKVGELPDRRNAAPCEEACRQLNRKLQGWRHKVSPQGARQFPAERV